jgi:GTPase SAR1 family protein
MALVSSNVLGFTILVIAVVGNKTDLADSSQLDIKEAVELGQTVNAVVRFTSAKEDTGVKDVFNILCDRIEDSESNRVQSSQSVGRQKKGGTKIIVDPKPVTKDGGGGCCK